MRGFATPLTAHNRHSLQLWQKGMHTGWEKCERKENCCAVCRRVYLLTGYAGRSGWHTKLCGLQGFVLLWSATGLMTKN